MRVVEALAGGVVAAVAVVLLVASTGAGIGAGGLFKVGLGTFIVVFLAVLLRTDRSISVGRR